ncbi:hypothetical protein [Actinoplanes siamensis]|nr:hypothetical protein [Actinoplanes siamensis]
MPTFEDPVADGATVPLPFVPTRSTWSEGPFVAHSRRFLIEARRNR